MDSSYKGVQAKHWKNSDNDIVICELCPHYCKIPHNASGKCNVRKNHNGSLYTENYGKITSLALDPIEKKPLYMFYPAKKILSVGGLGCNLNCPFCQNHNISLNFQNTGFEIMTPELLVDVAVKALSSGNIGLAYTYNEPFVGYEFIFDCSLLIRKAGLKNILVTNGYINNNALNEILPYIDALNIDIKGNTEKTHNMVGGTSEPAKNTVVAAYKNCHVEVTTLIIPGENENDVEDISKWLSSIDKNIPYHLSRFFPRYKYSGREPTPPELMYELYETAGKYLNNVFLGNM